MSHTVSANFTLPTILNTMKPVATSGAVKAKALATTSGTTGTNTSSTTGIGSTFLSLLSTELQNQDPTAPVDSTAMVGQMISLNQLDQLISINQKTTATPATTAPTAPATPPVPPAAPHSVAGLDPPASAAALSRQLFDPTAALASSPVSGQDFLNSLNSLNAPLNAATIGFPGSTNNSGGK